MSERLSSKNGFYSQSGIIELQPEEMVWLSWTVGIVTAIAGLIIGSFLNVVAIRLPRGESILWPGSRCMQCGHPLRSWDLVPIFSWLALRGRCRYCHAHISVQYPLVEALTAAVFVLIVWHFGITAETALLLVESGLLILSATVDARTLEIPDTFTFSALGVALVGRTLLLWPAIFNVLLTGLGSLLFFALLGRLMRRLLGREALGGADVLLMGTAGFLLGWPILLVAVLVAALSGLLFAFVSRPFLPEGEKLIPFGPFIVFGILFALFLGQPLWNLYMQLYM
ncbi:MAG: prepilin peptidase [Firmicutes bacterium]|nr:prepilin peptidase [Bacillota bacterium]